MALRISLRVKLVGIFLIVTALVIVIGIFGIRTTNEARTSFSDITNNHVPRLTALRKMRTVVAGIHDQAVQYAAATADPVEAEARKNALLDEINTLGSEEQQYISLVEADQKVRHNQTQVAFQTVRDIKNRFAASVTELIGLKEQGASAELLTAKTDELGVIDTDLYYALELAAAQEVQVIENVDKEIAAEVERRTDEMSYMVMLTALVGALLGLAVSISVARNLRKLKEGSAHIANGDFTHQIKIGSRDEFGELAASFTQMSDRLKESYRRIGFEKQRDEAILQSMGEGMVAVDRKGNVVLINGVALDLIELSEEIEAVNKPVSELLSLLKQDGKKLPAESDPVTTALSSGEAVNDVFGYKRKDGKQVLYNVDANPVILDGEVMGAIIVLRDVTKEREIDRMKTEFISLASHQLRTPLSAIRWFSEMLLSGDAGELQPEQKDFAKNISDSTERMIQLVNSLLNISRIESGRIMVDPKPTDLRELVGGIVNDLKAKTEEKQQSLIISVHDDLPKINLDPRLIGQVYLNLLTNAVKYTPKGGEISVFISKKDDQIVSQVTDNGYGIPKEQHDRIFQKFFRAANAVKVETDGTGLGLYLIKAIIESSGGKIWFDSEENKGTTFWFSIPLSGMQAKEGEVTLDV